MEAFFELTVLCRFCNMPMQMAETLKDEKGKILAVRYICGCQSPPNQLNIHSGFSDPNETEAKEK